MPKPHLRIWIIAQNQYLDWILNPWNLDFSIFMNKLNTLFLKVVSYFSFVHSLVTFLKEFHFTFNANKS